MPESEEMVIVVGEQYKRSEKIGKLVAAKAKAQASFTLAERASVNDAYKRGGKASTYADLGSVLKACMPHLSASGIAVFQPVTTKGRTVTVTTLLCCDEEFMETSMSADAKDTLPQSLISTTTYLRRAGIASLLVIGTGDDDDGNAASGLHVTATVEAQGPVQQVPAMSSETAERVASWGRMMDGCPRDADLKAIALEISRESLPPAVKEELRAQYARNLARLEKATA